MKSPISRAVLAGLMLAGVRAAPAQASCSAPANKIEAENCRPGTPQSVWDISPKTGDPSIVGFTDDISYNPGSTVSFKIDTDATSYVLNIYRMGYYGNMGARLVATVNPTALPTQPACLSDPTSGLFDCGNWAVTATWTIPTSAVSGVYVVKVIRNDTGGASQIYFVVRNDSGNEDILFNTADTTWQAYAAWQGNSLYAGSPSGSGAYKVSYNRPLSGMRGYQQSSFFDQEYPALRFLEANGYNMSYFTDVDADRRGALIKNHKIFLASGHEEYWSLAQRNNVEAARNAGVNMAFFGEEVGMEKTRWENSIDGTNTTYRTLVCYKESFPARGRIDPLDPAVWTGAWRDKRYSPPDDGGRPEITLVGNQFSVDAGQNDTMTVSADFANLRFWRNTAVAQLSPGQSLSIQQTLGTQIDEAPDNGFLPPGMIRMSSTTLVVPVKIASNYTWVSGPATHNLTFYKQASSGARVFSSGTMQWVWGLDANHDSDTNPPVEPALQQASVNILADMGAHPATLQPGLVPASPSTDTTPPVSRVLTPPQTYAAGTLVTISGTATDSGGGVVAGVEVSVDGGASWHPSIEFAASGTVNWTYSYTQTVTALVSPLSRATDDSGNIEGSGAGNPVPSVTSLAPAGAAVGGGGFTLGVTGNNFLNNSTVLWNGQNRATTFISATQLSAAILASDLAAAGSVAVTVLNPAPGGGSSAPFNFTISNQANPAPTLTGLSINSATAGAPAFTLSVSGFNLEPTSVVEWNGAGRTTNYVSSNTLTASILASDLATAGSALVSVFTPGPGGGVSATMSFTILSSLALNSTQIKVFPNPLNLKSAGVPMFNFVNVPANAQIRIFTVSGRWVKNIDSPNGIANWDLTNDSGQSVASGVYLYLVTDNQGDTQRGVIALVR